MISRCCSRSATSSRLRSRSARAFQARLPGRAPSVGEGLHHAPLVTYMRPLRQLDLRSARCAALFRVKGEFLAGLHLVFGGLREPVPFLVRLAQRALTALGFQFT